MSATDHRRGLMAYLFFTFALSSLFYFLILKSGHLGAGRGVYVTGLMWCPAAAALLTCRYLGRNIGSLGWAWGKTRYQLMSYVIPLLYATATYSMVWLTGLGGFYNKEFVAQTMTSFGLGPLPAWATILLYLFFVGTTGMIRSCSTALGEEIGWRGFLVPELARQTSFTATALVSGCIWALWHYPILIFADYHAGTPTWYGLTCFTVMVVAVSFIFAWMRLKSGSLWTGVLLHGSHNVFIQAFFTPLTTNTGRTRYIIDEFGAGLAIVSILFGAYFWFRRGEVSRTQVQAISAAA